MTERDKTTHCLCTLTPTTDGEERRMERRSWNSVRLVNALLLLVVAVAGAGGCEQLTNPVSVPGEAGDRLAAQAGAASGDAANDRAALMALYDATDGDNWTDNTNWGSDEDLADWYGVATYQGRVVEVILEDNGLSGELPAELGDLDQLEWLLLRHNADLSGGIPAELGNLGSLTWLALENSALSGKIPAELGNLSSLEVLSIINTSVSGSIPPELGNLSSLVALDLRQNDMSGGIPPELGNLSSLDILYIIDNGMSGSIPPELGNLSSLRWMALMRNSLSGEIPSELGHIGGLEHLFLDDNQLSGGVPSSLGNLAALERLHLQRNRFTGALPGTFLNLYLAENEFSWWSNRGLCIPNTEAFRAWMTRMGYADWAVNRSLCSADREALLGLHDALGGENWADSNWGDDADIRTWRGVTLDSDVRVTELRLGSSGLSGEIPDLLADLDMLEVLVLEGNGLVGEIPEAVMDLELDVFWWSDNPGLCVPDTDAFRTWLTDMRSTSGPICGR